MLGLVFNNITHTLCTAHRRDIHDSVSKFQCVLSIEVIPESLIASEMLPAADSPQPGPSGLAASLLPSTSTGTIQPPSRFVL